MVCIILLLVLCKTINKSQRARHLVIHTYVYVHLCCLQGTYTWAKQLNLLNPGFSSCGIGLLYVTFLRPPMSSYQSQIRKHMGSYQGPVLRKMPTVGLRLCCCSLEILNDF